MNEIQLITCNKANKATKYFIANANQKLSFLIVGFSMYLSFISSAIAQNYEKNFLIRANSVIKSFIVDNNKNFSQNIDNKAYNNFSLLVVQTSNKQQSFQNNQYIENEIFTKKENINYENINEIIRILNVYNPTDSTKEIFQQYLSYIIDNKLLKNEFGREYEICILKSANYLLWQLIQKKYPQLYPQAEQNLSQLNKWLNIYINSLYTNGLDVFTSLRYPNKSLGAWLNLFDFADNKEVKDYAQSVLDFYACEYALYNQGVTKLNNDTIFDYYINGFSGINKPLAWLWFSNDSIQRNIKTINYDNANISIPNSCIFAAISNYRPPLPSSYLANKYLKSKGMYFCSNTDYSTDNKFINNSFYVSKSFSIRANYFPYGGWALSDSALTSWNIMPIDSNLNQKKLFISGIGMHSPMINEYKHGNFRAPFDHVIHSQNVVIQLTKVPDNIIQLKDSVNLIFKNWREQQNTQEVRKLLKFNDFVIAENKSFLIISKDKSIKTIQKENLIFIFFEDFYVVVTPVNNSISPQLYTSPCNKYWYLKVHAPVGQLCGFVLETYEKQEFKREQTFINKALNNISLDSTRLFTDDCITYTTLKGDKIEAIYQQTGSFYEPLEVSDYQSNAENNHKINIQQPLWPSGTGHGRLANWKVNGKLADNAGYKWPVFDGPFFKLKNKVLEIENNDYKYTVDLSSGKPVFTLQKK